MIKELSPAEQIALLSKTTLALARCVGEADKVAVIFQTFKRLGFQRFRLYVHDQFENALRFRYAQEQSEYDLFLSDILIKPTNGILGRVFSTAAPHTFTAEKRTQTQYVPIFESPTSLLSVPIMKEGNPIAVLTFESKENDAFSSDHCVSALVPYQYLLATSLEFSAIKSQGAISWIKHFREKRVLILGKDNGDELALLLAIRSILKQHGYEGLLVKEHPDIPELSNEDKVRLFTSMCRFVVLENTFPAGQIAECKVCSTNRIVTACLREEGRGSSFMVTDYFNDFAFMSEFVYRDYNESLKEAVGQAVIWAEAKVEERRRYFDALYPWRATAVNQPPNT